MPMNNLVSTRGIYPLGETSDLLGLPINVKLPPYNASGSNATTTGDIDITTNVYQLTLQDAQDFQTGQGVTIQHAGPATSLTPPSGLTANAMGATGSTSITYAVAARDANGGCTAAATVTVSNANAVLSASNYVALSWTAVANAYGYIVYRVTTSGTSPTTTGLIGTPGDTSMEDTGLAILTAPDFIPPSAPAAPLGQVLNSVIVSGGGTATLTLADAAGSSVTGQVVKHDDTTAFSNACSSSTAVVVLPPGTYNIDFTRLPQYITNKRFVGDQATIQATKVNNTNGVADPRTPIANGNFQHCIFQCCIFSGPFIISGYAPFTSGSESLGFYNCTIQDFVTAFLSVTGPNIVFADCRWTQTSASLLGRAGYIGNVYQNFWVTRCSFNYAPTANTLIALNSAGIMLGNIWITDSRFLDEDQPGYTTDTNIDIEPSGNVPLENVHIEGNIFYNSKLYVSNATRVSVRNNAFHTTANLVSPVAWNIVVRNLQGAAPCTLVDIADNTITQDDGAYDYQATAIYVGNSGPISTLRVTNNQIQINGHATNSTFQAGFAFVAIGVDGSVGSVADTIIEGNAITYTAVPTSKNAAIFFNASGTNFTHISLNRNVLGGVSGATTTLYQLYNSGAASYETVHFDGNDISDSGVGLAIYTLKPTISELIVGNIPVNPLGPVTPPATPLNSGTAYQNTYGVPITIYQPAYASVAGTAGTVGVAMGSTSSNGTNQYIQLVSGASSSTAPVVCSLRVPPLWWFTFTASGTTLLNAVIQGE